MEALAKKYGSYEDFQQEFKAALMGLQGSGYVVASREAKDRYVLTDLCV